MGCMFDLQDIEVLTSTQDEEGCRAICWRMKRTCHRFGLLSGSAVASERRRRLASCFENMPVQAQAWSKITYVKKVRRAAGTLDMA